ncbi:phosphatidylinositol-specific phospholipase C domain-containing protein [Streptomyces sp. WAC07149]|uniref:phosphatidylinositol-specific phospholipase C domain-containing protein n=1 Tax=Streptomyces sp. WAC07149 TaxID=2487425 RepID=UPI000F7AB6E6|nr:phosphatidylinositol-specific phospholipase C domain-containing protein [Streptomyces sp. WAC07149]RST08821.1 phosphatidylinositol-specific phospholipase C domain-containing protein [Streptomyces sp. WAC07149]
MSRTTPHPAGVPPRRRSRRLASLMTACAALGAVLLAPGTAEAAGSTNRDAFENLGQADRAEWMWGIASDTRLSNMSIPGTHDTLSIHGGAWVQTQEDYGDSANTLAAQLDRGIRAIDIRARVSGGGAFTIHHGVKYQNANFDDVLTKAQSFLRQHPTESIVMRLKAECVYGSKSGLTECENDPDSTTPEKVRAIFGDYVRKYPGLFYAPSVSGGSQASVPTLGEVRGKVVLGSFDNAGADDTYGLKGFNDRKEDHWEPDSVGEKWNYVKGNVNKAITGNANDLYVTYSSASKFPSLSPTLVAGGYWEVRGGVNTEVPAVNYNLMKHLNSSAGRVGIIMTDFPGWGLVNAIIDHNDDNMVKGGQRSIWLVNADKTYSNSQYQGRCMVRGPEFDAGDGGLVTQRPCQSSPPSSHQWTATKPDTFDGKGYFWIKASNGKCLTMPYNNGTAPAAGTQLFWWPCETRWFSGSQMWNVMPTKLATSTGSRPAYYFINNWTGLCLSMDPATASTSGGKVTQDACPK